MRLAMSSLHLLEKLVEWKLTISNSLIYTEFESPTLHLLEKLVEWKLFSPRVYSTGLNSSLAGEIS